MSPAPTARRSRSSVGGPRGRRSCSSTARPADHTTFRIVGPMLGTTLTPSTRSTGAGGAPRATRSPYSIEREFEDVAAVAEALAADRGCAGRRRRPLVRRAVRARGGAPDGRDRAGSSATRAPRRRRAPATTRGHRGAPARALDAGDRDGALALFMAEVVGMSPDALAAYRANPVWPARAPRRGRSCASSRPRPDADGVARRARPRSASPCSRSWVGSLPVFHEATLGLDARLADGRVVVIDGRPARRPPHPSRRVRRGGRGFLT